MKVGQAVLPCYSKGTSAKYLVILQIKVKLSCFVLSTISQSRQFLVMVTELSFSIVRDKYWYV